MPKLKRRWFQFGLMQLLIVVLAIGSCLGLLARKINKKQRERQAVAEIRKVSGWVHYDWEYQDDQNPPGPACVRWLFGDDFLADVWFVHLEWKEIDEAGLSRLTGLAQVRFIRLTGNRGISDAGLVHLKQLKSLKTLGLKHCTAVTDAGVDEIREALPHCRIDR